MPSMIGMREATEAVGREHADGVGAALEQAAGERVRLEAQLLRRRAHPLAGRVAQLAAAVERLRDAVPDGDAGHAPRRRSRSEPTASLRSWFRRRPQLSRKPCRVQPLTRGQSVARLPDKLFRSFRHSVHGGKRVPEAFRDRSRRGTHAGSGFDGGPTAPRRHGGTGRPTGAGGADGSAHARCAARLRGVRLDAAACSAAGRRSTAARRSITASSSSSRRATSSNFRRLGDPARSRTSRATGSPTPTSTRCSRRSAGRPAAPATGWTAFVDETVALHARGPGATTATSTPGSRASTASALAASCEWSHELYCLGHMIQAAVAVARGTRPRRPARRRAPVRRPRRRALRRGRPRRGSTATRRSRRALVELYRHTGEARVPDAGREAWSSGAGRGLLAGYALRRRSTCRTTCPVREATEADRPRRAPALPRRRRRPTSTSRTATVAAGRRWRSCGERMVDGEDVRHRRASARATATRRSATRTSCRRTARTARRARRSPASSGTGACCSPRATGATPRRWSACCTTAIAVSTSLDGCHFFYSNPLHLRAGHDGSTEDAPSERLRLVQAARAARRTSRGSSASLHHYVATRRRRRRPAAPADGRPRRDPVPTAAP